MSLEHIVAVPYKGQDFVVATSEHLRIQEIKINGKWWPWREVSSVALVTELQRTLDAMPLNTEAA